MGAALLSVYPAYPASFIGCLFGSVVGAVAPLDLLVQLELQLLVLLHQLVIVAALHIVLHYVQSVHYDTLVEENKKLRYELDQEMEWKTRTDG